jgi:hypothetical protein
MTHSRKSAFLLGAGLSLACVLGIAPRAGARTASPTQSTPAPAAKPIKAKFTVMRMLYTAIQVRGIANPLENHTFSYSDSIRDKMQRLFNQGGYQYGDQVEIWYERGAEVALKIKGKRSKSH